MTRIFLNIILGAIALFLGFVSMMLLPKKITPPPVSNTTISSSPTPIQLLIPQTALTGILTKITGTVEKIPWDTNDQLPATAGGILYQAEEILTKDNSTATITILNLFECLLTEQSALLLGNLQPTTPTVHHKKGKTTCNVEGSIPLSIRALGALVELQQGTAIIAIDERIVTIAVTTGTAKLAFVTNDNATNVWQLEDSQQAVINMETGRVTTTATLLSTNP